MEHGKSKAMKVCLPRSRSALTSRTSNGDAKSALKYKFLPSWVKHPVLGHRHVMSVLRLASSLTVQVCKHQAHPEGSRHSHSLLSSCGAPVSGRAPSSHPIIQQSSVIMGCVLSQAHRWFTMGSDPSLKFPRLWARIMTRVCMLPKICCED